ncbi:MAG: T9SS type A sorting domain-containing protein, partial [Bacteroidota bacterium]
MKKFYTLILFAVFFKSAFSQCTPDPNLNSTGFTPAELPFAYTDASYSQVLSFKAPKDTTTVFNGNTVDVVIDSVIMLDLVGIPENFGYQCLSRCAIPGGERGCALLSGQAQESQIGSYRIKIFLQTYFKIKNSPNQFSRIDSGDSYQFRIYKTTGRGIITGADARTEIKAYPNPANSSIRFDLSMLSHHSTGTVIIVDVLGRKVYEGAFENNNAGKIDVAGWKNGIYKCMIKTGEDTYYNSF